MQKPIKKEFLLKIDDKLMILNNVNTMVHTLKSLTFCFDLIIESCHNTNDIRIKFQCSYVNLEGIFFMSSVNNLISSRGKFNFSHEI